jgi:hypothetical protein
VQTWSSLNNLKFSALGQSPIYIINDRGQEPFRFHLRNDFQGDKVLLEENAVDNFELRTAGPTGPLVYEGSLGFVQTSDVLLIELEGVDLPSPLLSPVLVDNRLKCPGGRMAIESLAELIRVAASRLALKLFSRPNQEYGHVEYSSLTLLRTVPVTPDFLVIPGNSLPL